MFFFSKKLTFIFVKLDKSFDQTCVNTCIDFIVTERTFSFFLLQFFFNNVCRRIIYKTGQQYALIMLISYFSKNFRSEFFFRNPFGMIPKQRRLLLAKIRYVDRHQYQTQMSSVLFQIGLQFAHLLENSLNKFASYSHFLHIFWKLCNMYNANLMSYY